MSDTVHSKDTVLNLILGEDLLSLGKKLAVDSTRTVVLNLECARYGTFKKHRIKFDFRRGFTFAQQKK